MIEALVLDFDGVIVDTETPLFHAWAHTYEVFGAAPIEHADWCTSLGRNESDPLYLDPLVRLLDHLGEHAAADEIQAVRRAERDRLLAAAAPTPGLDELLDQADRMGIFVAIASSSPRDWLDRHLGPRNLQHRFALMSCAGGTIPGKPDPAVYRNPCEALGVDPSVALAVEDSPHGAAAAKAAGMPCVAVPTTLSAPLDFSLADAVVDTLSDIDLRDPFGSANAQRFRERAVLVDPCAELRSLAQRCHNRHRDIGAPLWRLVRKWRKRGRRNHASLAAPSS